MRIQKNILSLLLIAIIIISQTACNETSNQKAVTNTSTPDAKEVKNDYTFYTVGETMMDMKFNIEEFSVKAGENIRIKLVNNAKSEAMVHNIVITRMGHASRIGIEAIKAGEKLKYVPNDPAVIAASGLAQPNETILFEFVAPEKGTYEFVCTYPGHYMNMRGLMHVVD